LFLWEGEKILQSFIASSSVFSYFPIKEQSTIFLLPNNTSDQYIYQGVRRWRSLHIYQLYLGITFISCCGIMGGMFFNNASTIKTFLYFYAIKSILGSTNTRSGDDRSGDDINFPSENWYRLLTWYSLNRNTINFRPWLKTLCSNTISVLQGYCGIFLETGKSFFTYSILAASSNYFYRLQINLSLKKKAFLKLYHPDGVFT